MLLGCRGLSPQNYTSMSVQGLYYAEIELATWCLPNMYINFLLLPLHHSEVIFDLSHFHRLLCSMQLFNLQILSVQSKAIYCFFFPSFFSCILLPFCTKHPFTHTTAINKLFSLLSKLLL